MLLSRALKYNLGITPRLYRPAFLCLMELLIIGSIWSWQPNWFVGQTWIQWLLTLCVLLHGFHAYRHQLHQPTYVSLSEDGRWLFSPVVPAQTVKNQAENIMRQTESRTYSGLPAGEPLRLSRHSKATTWLLWIHIKHKRKTHWFWVFRDEVSEQDYRRLCLAIRYCQHYAVE